jgi:hypothetical protein
MAETKVILCDDCKNVVAIAKCNICNKDLCEKCTEKTSFVLPKNIDLQNYQDNNFMEFYTCELCEKLMKKFPKGEWNNIKDTLLKKFQARLMLKTIEGENGKINN